MNRFIVSLLSAALAALPLCASAGVAPAAPNSALTQSGAKIAPAKQPADDKAKQVYQESTPEDPAR